MTTKERLDGYMYKWARVAAVRPATVLLKVLVCKEIKNMHQCIPSIIKEIFLWEKKLLAALNICLVK